MAAGAKPIDDAKALYNQGKYEQAVEKLKAILKAAPKDGTANYYLGLSYIALDKPAAAVAPLEKAAERGVADAYKRLAVIAIDDYDADAASDYLADYEAQMRKNKKDASDADQLRSRIVMVKNMLARVEKIAIVDSIVVDKADFFKRYKLSPSAGKLISGSILAHEYASKDPKVVYVPESNREIFWAMAGDNGHTQLYASQVLDDGTFEMPEPLGGELNDGGDADYPYFMSDGVTFYFANNGDNSLGGYDIFLSRRDPDGSVLNPQNVGMPYNSAYDDYMLVIDEAANRGWWATDRNQIPGKVTIYEFIPNETRVNYDPDDENIAGYAFVSSIAATTQGMSIPEAQDMENNSTEIAEAEFVLPMGKGKTYTKLDDFRNPQAKKAMSQYLRNQQGLEMMKKQLQELRKQYGAGDRTVGNDILSLEKRVNAARDVQLQLQNQAISLERGLN